MTKISIVLPTYNERDNVLVLIPQILNLKIPNYEVEIIIVDDNSPDGTALEIKNQFGKNKAIRLILRKNSDGLAGAILAGINASSGEVVVGMDADGNHDPAILPKMAKMLMKSDVVVASRFIVGGGMEDKLRFYFTLGFNLVIRFLLGFPTTDNMSGYYMTRKKTLKSLPLNYIYRGYGEYHLRLLWLLKENNKKICEVPVFYHERLYGKSKSRLMRMFLVYVLECVKLRFFRKANGLLNSNF